MPKLPATKCNQKALRRLDELAVAKLAAQAGDPNYYPPTPWMLDFFNHKPLR